MHQSPAFGAGEQEIAERLTVVERLGADDRTLAEGHLALGQLMFWNGRTSDLVETGRRALAHAVRCGDPILEAEALGRIGVGTFYGRATWTEVETHARTSLLEADRLGQGVLGARLGIAGAAAAQGRFEEARALYLEHEQDLVERGQTFLSLSSRHYPAWCELLAGNYADAEAHARTAWDGLGLLGERGLRATAGALLSEAVAHQRRLEEARELLDETDLITSEDDWLTIAHVSWTRAIVALGEGDHDAAVRHARAATEVADAREYYSLRPYYWICLGRVLVAAGRDEDAREALAEARRLADIKQSPLDRQRISELLDELEARDSTP